MKANTRTMIEYNSPATKRLTSNFSQQILNSWIHNSNKGWSPSFINYKSNINLTENRRNQLRNYIIPSTTASTSKRQSDQGVDIYDNYYAINNIYKNDHKHSAITTVHNTPLKTSTNKIFEMKNRDYSASRPNPNIKPISSIKNACYTVTRSQRKRRFNEGSIVPNKNEEINTANLVYDFGSSTPNKPSFTPNIKSKMYERSFNPTQRAYKKAVIKKHSSPNGSNIWSTPTKVSTKNESNVNDFSFEYIENKMAAGSKPTRNETETEKSWTGNIFSKLKSMISKEPTIFPWKWSSQDEALNWCERAAKWVIKAERKRGGKPNQRNYLFEYEDLVAQLDRNYSTNPNDSIDTITHQNFASQQSQIEKDIDRTLNNHVYFGHGKEGQDHLRAILKIIALKYTDIGYVQGMNFLVVSLLYHWSPEITLFLCTVLIEDYELCDVYRVDVAGLHSRNSVIKSLIQRNLVLLNNHFEEIGLDPQMFTTEWVLDLFSHTIPLNFYGKFLDNFFEDGSSNNRNRGWNYFNAVIIWILSSLEKDLIEKYEWDEVLVFIKNYVKEKSSFFGFGAINWDKIMNTADNLCKN